MSQISVNLFPKNEEWATGDESLDLKLNLCLKQTMSNLNLENCYKFYNFAKSIKTRAFNPHYHKNIELVTKALLSYLNPNAPINLEFKKLVSNYNLKIKREFEIANIDMVIEALTKQGHYRFENQIDFYLEKNEELYLNPYVDLRVHNSKYELLTKAIYKDLTRSIIENKKSEKMIELVSALDGGQNILVIKNFGEIWFTEDQFYSIANF